METALLAIPLASALLGAVANVMGKWLAADIRPAPFAALSFIGIFLWITPVMLVWSRLVVSPTVIGLLVLVAVIDTGANYMYFKALDTVEVSDVSALGALAPLFTTVFAVMFLPEAFRIDAVIAGITITVAAYIINVDRDSLFAPLQELHRSGRYYPLLSGLLFGLSAVPVKLLLSTYDAVSPATLYWVRAALITVVFILVFRPQLRGHGRRVTGWVMARAGVIAVSWLLFYVAIQRLNVIVAVALAYTTPMFTLLLAHQRLGEAITMRRVIAVILTVIAIAVVHTY